MIRLMGMMLLFFGIQGAWAAEITLNSANQGGDSFFIGQLLEGPGTPRVGVVLLHGRCGHPQGPVVEELRNSLNRAGYSTLSIETPLPKNASCLFSDYVADVQGLNYVFPELYARVRESINHLEGLGVQEVVLMGFSLGSRFAAAHVARGQLTELPILGLMGVGMYATSNVDPLDLSLTLDEVPIPVLDIYGDADTLAEQTKTSRTAAYLAGSGLSYIQVILPCSANLTTNQCHSLDGLKGSDTMPLEIVTNTWMNCNAPLDGIPDCQAISVPGPGIDTSANSGGGSGSLGVLALLVLGILLQLRRRIDLRR